jgi:hypothetical protein
VFFGISNKKIKRYICLLINKSKNKMNIDPNSGEIITQARAIELINAFSVKFPNQVVSSFIGTNNVENILSQTDCIGIRIYNGYDNTEEKISLVLIGVDSEGKDILRNGIIYDKIVTCPPTCAENTILS